MKVEEDTPHVLEKGKTLGGEIGVGEYLENEKNSRSHQSTRKV